MTANLHRKVETMPLNPMTNAPKPVPGDDLAYVSVRYEDVPTGFRIKDLVVDQDDCPLTYALWADICAKADLVYARHEIVGDTIADFFDGLRRAYQMNADTFERLLEVYNDDIAKPILGRTETVTYGKAGQPVTVKQTHVDTEVRQADTQHIDVPIEGEDDNPTYKDGTTSKVLSGKVEDTSEQTGTVTTELSDLGVRPNYESLNGFLDNNRTALNVFCDMFKNCFTLHRTMTW